MFYQIEGINVFYIKTAYDIITIPDRLSLTFAF